MTDDEVASLAHLILEGLEAARAGSEAAKESWQVRDAQRQQLAEEFGRRYGWTWTRFDFSSAQLHRRNARRGEVGLPPRHDYGNGYLDGILAAASTIQPYDVTDGDRAAMGYWAEGVGLVAAFPSFPSWRHPGRSTLCVFAKPVVWASAQAFYAGRGDVP